MVRAVLGPALDSRPKTVPVHKQPRHARAGARGSTCKALAIQGSGKALDHDGTAGADNVFENDLTRLANLCPQTPSQTLTGPDRSPTATLRSSFAPPIPSATTRSSQPWVKTANIITKVLVDSLRASVTRSVSSHVQIQVWRSWYASLPSPMLSVLPGSITLDNAVAASNLGQITDV